MAAAASVCLRSLLGLLCSNLKTVNQLVLTVFQFKVLKILVKTSISVIVDASFDTGGYPNNLKIAKVVALHKKEASDNFTKYWSLNIFSINIWQ